MGEVVVIVVNPFIDGDFKVKRVIPVVAPDDVFFDGAHDPFGIGVTGLPRFALRNRISDFKGKVPEISRKFLGIKCERYFFKPSLASQNDTPRPRLPVIIVSPHTNKRITAPACKKIL